MQGLWSSDENIPKQIKSFCKFESMSIIWAFRTELEILTSKINQIIIGNLKQNKIFKMKRQFACDDSGGPVVSSPIVNYFMHFDLSHHALGMARVHSLIQTIKHFIHAYKPWKFMKMLGRQTVIENNTRTLLRRSEWPPGRGCVILLEKWLQILFIN